MQPTDDKQYSIAKATRRASRRSVSKRDFSLPKPYRRQLFSEEPERLTRMQLALLGFAGVMVSTLIGVTALMAHESELSPDGKMIVAAAKLESGAQRAPVEQAEAQLTAYAAPAAKPEPPALRHDVKSAALAPVRFPPAKKPFKAKPAERLTGVSKKPLQHARITAALLGRESRIKQVRFQLAPPAPALDPDVALITAILLLTPAPVPTAAPAISMELVGRGQPVCVATQPKDSNCHDGHKLKH